MQCLRLDVFAFAKNIREKKNDAFSLAADICITYHLWLSWRERLGEMKRKFDIKCSRHAIAKSVIPRRWLDEYGYEMYSNEKRSCKACKTRCFILFMTQIYDALVAVFRFCLSLLSPKAVSDREIEDRESLGNYDDGNTEENFIWK